MDDVEHWGVLTIGTGLGNARFSNRRGNEDQPDLFGFLHRRSFHQPLVGAFCSTDAAAACPATRPSTVAVSKPFPDKYPSARGPETPAAAPPAAKIFGS